MWAPGGGPRGTARRRRGPVQWGETYGLQGSNYKVGDRGEWERFGLDWRVEQGATDGDDLNTDSLSCQICAV